MAVESQQEAAGPFPWLQGVRRQDAVWLVLMSVMLFVMLLPISSYVAALPFIQEEWELNNTQVGAIYSAYMAGYALSALFVIPLTDRFGPKHIFLGATILSVVAHLLFPLAAGSMVSGLILRAVAGVGLVGVYMPGLRAIAQRFSSGGRGAAVGLFVTAFYGANAGSLIITGALMAVFDWRDAYLTVSLVAVVSVPMAYALLRFLNHEPVGESSGRLDIAVLKSAPVRYLILGYTLHAVQLYAVRVWLPVFLLSTLVARGIDSAQAAVTAATVGGLALAAGSFGPVMGGIISDRLGRATSASAIFVLSGTCALIIGWTGGLAWPLIVVLGVVYGWAISADSAIYSTGITEVANPLRLGSTMAMQAFIGFMGGVVGPIAFGSVLDISTDSYQWGLAFSALGVLAVVAIIGMQRLRTLPQSRMLAKGKG